MDDILKYSKTDIIELWNNRKMTLLLFIILFMMFNIIEAIVSKITNNIYIFSLVTIIQYIGYFVIKISFQKIYLKHFLINNVSYNNSPTIFGKTIIVYLRCLIIPTIALIAGIIIFFSVFRIIGKTEYLINIKMFIIWFFIIVVLFIFFLKTVNIIFIEHIVIIEHKYYKMSDIIKESKYIVNKNRIFYSIIYFISIILPIIISIIINSFVNIYLVLITTGINILYILIMISVFKNHVVSTINKME